MGDTVWNQARDGAPGRQRTPAACDACRARKVKCVFLAGGATCSICKELDIECTRVKPRKKRGPKNRYVQALRSHLDTTARSVDLESPFKLPDTAASPSLETNSLDATSHLGLESVAPLPTVHRLICDWFDWIHPVAPIFHRDQSMRRIARCATEKPSPSFIILVASLCAATVASLRRRRPLYGSVTVDHCLDLAERLGLWSRFNPITLESCLSMYNFSSAAHHEFGFDSPVVHRLAAEAGIGVKFLLYHSLKQMSLFDQQVLKRLYWLIFAGQCTSDLHGRPLLMLHSAHEQINSLVPLDIRDDELLTGTAQDSGRYRDDRTARSYICGLNALSRLFLIWPSSQATQTQTIANLLEHVKRAQQALESLPPELSWKSIPARSTNGDNSTTNRDGDFGIEVQVVNLKVTQLHIRSNLLEQMHQLARQQNLLITPSAIVEERHRVVDELLQVLDGTPNEVFDANGYSIIPKIRDIGSALLDEVRTGSRGGNTQASVNLDRLLKKLENLDVRPLPMDTPL